ncbi:MAG: MbnP family protein [Bacteroidia bacterium]
MKSILKITALFLLIGFSACKKEKKDPDPEPETPAATTGVLKVEFEHMVYDTINLAFNQKYVNAKGDTFTVTKLKYYISNIVITKNDNSTFTESNSYHLIDLADPATTLLSIANVPFDSYKSISFTLGVDSAANCSGAQAGDLAQSKGMFWTWNSGYIMFKLEGTAPKSPAPNHVIEYHIGGFGGANKVQRNFNFNFASTPANVSSSITPQIHLTVNISELFEHPNLIDVTQTGQYSQLTAGAGSKLFADNYADMISFEHVHN